MLNSQYGIKRCSNNIVGVQQSIKVRIIQSLTHLVNEISKESTSIPETFRIKIIGDRTLTTRGFNIVYIAFMILEENIKHVWFLEITLWPF